MKVIRFGGQFADAHPWNSILVVSTPVTVTRVVVAPVFVNVSSAAMTAGSKRAASRKRNSGLIESEYGIANAKP